MKILKPGKNFMTDACTGKGNGGKGCGAKLEFERNDLRYYGARDYPWRYQPACVSFRCPQCGVVTDLAEKKWPANETRLEKWTQAWANGDES